MPENCIAMVKGSMGGCQCYEQNLKSHVSYHMGN